MRHNSRCFEVLGRIPSKNHFLEGMYLNAYNVSKLGSASTKGSVSKLETITQERSMWQLGRVSQWGSVSLFGIVSQLGFFSLFEVFPSWRHFPVESVSQLGRVSQ
jgi:hypothetical protein